MTEEWPATHTQAGICELLEWRDGCPGEKREIAGGGGDQTEARLGIVLGTQLGTSGQDVDGKNKVVRESQLGMVKPGMQAKALG